MTVNVPDAEKIAQLELALEQANEVIDAQSLYIAELTKPVSFAETDSAISSITAQEDRRIEWLTGPLFMAQAVRHIIHNRSREEE